MSDMPSLEIRVRLTPRGGRDEIEGWMEDGDGKRLLKARVSAPADKGKANQALIELLAREWRIPKTSITLSRGGTSRVKTLILNQIPEILRK